MSCSRLGFGSTSSSRRRRGEGPTKSRAGSGRSSSAALHAKTFAVDRSRIFVGSFNFDQRSARLNTEMELAHRSPVLAERLGAFFDVEVPRAAYEVRLNAGWPRPGMDRTNVFRRATVTTPTRAPAGSKRKGGRLPVDSPDRVVAVGGVMAIQLRTPCPMRVPTEAPMATQIARTRRRDRNSSAGTQSGRSWANWLTRSATRNSSIPTPCAGVVYRARPAMGAPLEVLFTASSANCAASSKLPTRAFGLCMSSDTKSRRPVSPTLNDCFPDARRTGVGRLRSNDLRR